MKLPSITIENAVEAESLTSELTGLGLSTTVTAE